MKLPSNEEPIYRVDPRRIIEPIGSYLPRERRLVLDREGYPLLAPGEHAIDDEDLPWVLQDTAPTGFIGQRFAQWFSALRLPQRSRDWSALDALRAVCEAVHDLSGNLVIGRGSYARYQHIFGGGRQPGPARSEAVALFLRLANDALDESIGLSSLGGERPKFSLRLADGAALLVKFSPPTSTLLGARWRDLLHLEMHAAQTLRSAGIAAVESGVETLEDRAFLRVERFDCCVGGGRVGCVTWASLSAARYGIINAAKTHDVAALLHADGFLTDDELRRFNIAHAFSAAIGNDDTHLGNYALLIDERGRSALAPVYDVVPMQWAPRNDELPDARVRPAARSDLAEVRSLVQRLVAAVEADRAVSRPFVDAWRAMIAANL